MIRFVGRFNKNVLKAKRKALETKRFRGLCLRFEITDYLLYKKRVIKILVRIVMTSKDCKY